MSRTIKSLVVALFTSMVAVNFAQAVPLNGLLLGLDASQNLSTTGGGVVNGWGDLNGNVQRWSSNFNSPTLGSLTTTNGSHAAISFNGNSGINLNDGAALALQTISVFVVANLNADQNSRIFAADIGSNGWASGIADSGPANVTKWYNGAGGSGLQDTTNLTMTVGKGYQISTSTSGTGSTASLYDGTTLTSNTSGNTTISYGSLQTTLGYLNGNSQSLNGNIAEVLVYNNAAAGYNAADINAYLHDQFFTPEPSSIVLMVLGSVGLVLTARRRRARAVR